ncbi:DUF2759 domain-containing protein [Jeotgalicoccus meleagridis]|jgi:di/tricarboxylate transporter|uniref:DUF2759 domain-containing protein n=1 Tax=Jeotgalicoccus meleagridis TaxID=2759181 RepID=A0A6V7RJ28_9STAP|nr:DUF2759 domain-containing protein [Jeotgalicoccus meleagridis]CAD2078083.1 hypothetical protein JEODO184_01303 [Jeotgalicoccus meleagridis]HIW37480.1 DUF2759 domain-containing protein [Candidatus Jeotgalicoccus stercoravium]
MPFFDTGELFSIGGVTIRIGVNALSLLMALVAVFGIIGLLNSMKAKNILAIVFSGLTVLVFGLWALATIFTFGYPNLG